MALASCSEDQKSQETSTELNEGKTRSVADQISPRDEELKLFNLIKKNYENDEHFSVTSRSEEFYKNFRLSDKMDSVELMYERALDVLDSIEMAEE